MSVCVESPTSSILTFVPGRRSTGACCAASGAGVTERRSETQSPANNSDAGGLKSELVSTINSDKQLFCGLSEKHFQVKKMPAGSAAGIFLSNQHLRIRS